MEIPRFQWLDLLQVCTSWTFPTLHDLLHVFHGDAVVGQDLLLPFKDGYGAAQKMDKKLCFRLDSDNPCESPG